MFPAFNSPIDMASNSIQVDTIALCRWQRVTRNKKTSDDSHSFEMASLIYRHLVFKTSITGSATFAEHQSTSAQNATSLYKAVLDSVSSVTGKR